MTRPDLSPFTIRPDDLAEPAVRALLAFHLAQSHANSPPGSVYALDLAGLLTPDITVWTVWDGVALAGVGALRELGDAHGELKSMRTHPDHLRRGVASLLLDHIINEARRRGLRRLSLETGTGPAFEAALALYRNRGFTEGEAIAGYARTGFNRFFHMPLRAPPTEG
jgi:putative acetyltransferase